MQRIQYHRSSEPEELRLETYELPALGEYVHDPRRSGAPSARISQLCTFSLSLVAALKSRAVILGVELTAIGSDFAQDHRVILNIVELHLVDDDLRHANLLMRCSAAVRESAKRFPEAERPHVF